MPPRKSPRNPTQEPQLPKSPVIQGQGLDETQSPLQQSPTTETEETDDGPDRAKGAPSNRSPIRPPSPPLVPDLPGAEPTGEEPSGRLAIYPPKSQTRAAQFPKSTMFTDERTENQELMPHQTEDPMQQEHLQDEENRLRGWSRARSRSKSPSFRSPISQNRRTRRSPIAPPRLPTQVPSPPGDETASESLRRSQIYPPQNQTQEFLPRARFSSLQTQERSLSQQEPPTVLSRTQQDLIQEPLPSLATEHPPQADSSTTNRLVRKTPSEPNAVSSPLRTERSPSNRGKRRKLSQDAAIYSDQSLVEPRKEGSMEPQNGMGKRKAIQNAAVTTDIKPLGRTRRAGPLQDAADLALLGLLEFPEYKAPSNTRLRRPPIRPPETSSGFRVPSSSSTEESPRGRQPKRSPPLGTSSGFRVPSLSSSEDSPREGQPRQSPTHLPGAYPSSEGSPREEQLRRSSPLTRSPILPPASIARQKDPVHAGFPKPPQRTTSETMMFEAFSESRLRFPQGKDWSDIEME
ncbi:hypothetical protein N656DRAFT_820259 [Canariomyces notabilis]|uniref:Uncharacterized protein n=1 Tax=Canariomyces notabilis TaxID=2074819 RepID=A0AAN6QC06_9PEZI|nr:hypothetical protein N656DRAFT_820259 [Canariomyces arenarius]